MCWIGPRIEHRAAEDIVTFKLLYRDSNTHQLYSFYRRFEYKLNTLYKCILGISSSYGKNYIRINKGFHSYSERCRIKKSNVFYYGVLAPDTWMYLESVRYSDDLIFIKTIIPKGSIYYQTEYGEVVSNQIILLEEWKGEVLE